MTASYWFITGTDTDCGKTYVTCQLIALLQAQGFRAMGIKPVASGCKQTQGRFISDDAQRIQRANNNSLEICPWAFELAVSPHIAARESHRHVNVQQIADFCFSQVFSGMEKILIEGAGGLMVPLNAQETWVDFLQLTKMPVILVVGMRLGCINHALLTAATLRQANIPCSGWIANCLDPQLPCLQDCIDTLTARLDIPYWGAMGYEGRALKGAFPSIDSPYALL